jgi:hypothetical protein
MLKNEKLFHILSIFLCNEYEDIESVKTEITSVCSDKDKSKMGHTKYISIYISTHYVLIHYTTITTCKVPDLRKIK